MIGKTLAHYEITSQLGRGGMGEVYQAKDLKLGRDVAIKVLPEEFARDADRVARFQREAKLLASLNHPNIAAIHGPEASGGTNFLVLELVEGQTLADRIKAGPIPVEESLKLALQIAEALEAAHEKGVIHRDLKPANIKVTPEGKVKVLDFGLAKAFAGDKEEVNLSNSPTLSDAATQQGVILGTAAHMGPEQARGKPVDKRADIWAFGCVLFEMFTDAAAQPAKIRVQSLESGKQKELFPGIIARYLPTGHIVYASGSGGNLLVIPFNLDKLEATGGPVPLVNAVRNYAVSDSGTLVYIPGTTAAAAPNQRTLVWVDRKGKEEPLAATPQDYRSPRISPDGTKVALTINADGKSDIWIWDLVRETMTRLTFDEASGTPLWTLDGKRIAFSSRRGGKAVTGSDVYWKAADGTGKDEKLGSEPDRGLYPWSWSGDGKTLALLEFPLSGNANFDIGTLSVQGDRKRTPLLKEKYAELFPQISRNGRWMAYTSNESGKFEVYVRPFPDVEGGRWQLSTSGGDTPLWSPDGRELFYRNGDEVMSVSAETEPTFKPGKTMPLFRGMYVAMSIDDGHPWDISPDGKRFLMIKPPASTGAPPAAPTAAAPRKINIVANWLEELKQRVPVK